MLALQEMLPNLGRTYDLGVIFKSPCDSKILNELPCNNKQITSNLLCCKHSNETISST